MDQQEVSRDQLTAQRTGQRVRPSERVQDPMPRSKRQRRTAAKPAGACQAARDAEADDRATRKSVRNGMLAMLVAMTVLLLFNSAGLRMWVRDLPGNAVTDQLVVVSSKWHEMMKRAGVAAPKAFVQEAIADLRDQSWRETVALPTEESDGSRVN